MRIAALLYACFFLAALGSAPVAFAASQPIEATDQKSESQSARTIELESPDRDIEKRLNLLFQELEDLQQVTSDVRGGVVTLSGIVLTAKDRQKAGNLASRLAGVVSVENEIKIDHRVERRLEPMIAKVDEMLKETIAFLPLLILSLAAFLGIWAFGRLLTRSGGLLGKVAPNPLVQTLLMQVIRLMFILVGIIIAMRIMGATAMLGSVLGAAGVVGLAIGFAIRDTVENYIASILLSIRRPFAPNDHVIIEGMEGRVTRLNSRATFLTSFDGSELRIPNAIVYKAKITNFSQIPERRFDFVIGVGYESDLCLALGTALAAVKNSSGVLSDPPPQAMIDGLDASTVSIKVLGWVDLMRSDFAKVRSEAIRTVKQAFDDKGISMPAPIQNIRVLNGEENQRAFAVANVEPEVVSDTTKDHTIELKVHAIRRQGEEDLLTTEAPKE